MAILKPFRGIRPIKSIAKEIAARPYDVLNSQEARDEVAGNPYSLLHITKPEIDLDPEVDVHSQSVYDKAVENYKNFIKKGWLIQDDKEKLYICTNNE